MFACIYIPDFPVEAIVRAEPLLRERAVVVLDGKPPVVRILALNEKAREMGMEAGMTKLQAAIFTAQESVVSHPNPQRKQGGHIDCSLRQSSAHHLQPAFLRQRSLEQEKSAHAALLDMAHGFTPRVEDTSDDRLLLDLSGLERLHGSATNMGRTLAARVSSMGLEANIGVAANPDTAMHAACGFSGITVIDEGEEAKRLGGLPLHVLFDSFDLLHHRQQNHAGRERRKLREQMLDTLERWGVRDFRTLSLLPDHALASRLGEHGARLQRLARGSEMRTLTLCRPDMRFEEALELEYAVESLEPLSFLLNRLLEQLCARLESRSLAAHELQIRLQLEQRIAEEETTSRKELLASTPHNVRYRPLFQRKLRLPVAMRDARIFLKLLQLELEAHPPGAPVIGLSILAQPAPPRSAQQGLFLPLAPEAEKLEITLARINAVVGERRAGSARLLDTHRPDAFVVERFAGAEEQPALSSTTLTLSDTEAVVAPVSLRIFRPARQLRVCTVEGRPMVVSAVKPAADLAALSGQVLWSAGPWRSSGEWWTETLTDAANQTVAGPWDREEWDIALANESDGSVGLYRIYCDIGTGKWFAHASYD